MLGHLFSVAVAEHNAGEQYAKQAAGDAPSGTNTQRIHTWPPILKIRPKKMSEDYPKSQNAHLNIPCIVACGGS